MEESGQLHSHWRVSNGGASLIGIAAENLEFVQFLQVDFAFAEGGDPAQIGKRWQHPQLPHQAKGTVAKGWQEAVDQQGTKAVDQTAKEKARRDKRDPTDVTHGGRMVGHAQLQNGTVNLDLLVSLCHDYCYVVDRLLLLRATV
jgi:hypothetical protein